MQANVSGSPMAVLEVVLESPEERLLVEAGKTAWMDHTVQMRTTAMGHGGILGALKRAAGGGPWFWSELSGSGRVGIAATLPGSIESIDLRGTQGVLAHRSAFLAGSGGVHVGLGFQKQLGAGLFGGDGFLLQHLSGDGTAWVQLGGSFVAYDLPAGQTLLVHPQHVGMFDAQMSFEITMVRGIRNRLFGGEGLFFCRLQGPGRVYCQSMAVPQLAQDLEPYLRPSRA